ncbi:MAG TPA: LemA family protein [Candidatus Limnocylindrales bacterium]|nr:LemA family protein [Candidatus Limnocylindrales bacterium]
MPVNPAVLAATFAVGTVVAILVFLVAATYNDVVALARRIDKAWANIEVALQQRHDQLPALVDAVRGVMTFERNVLTEVTEARAAFSRNAPIPVQAATSEATSRALRTLFATVERYPEVRSAENVLSLQQEIERLEAMIADRRELYNDQIYRYNARIGQIPAVFLSSLFGWRSRPFFDAEPEAAIRPAGL